MSHRILLVEDDAINVKFMKVVLTRKGGCEVLVSEDVAEILELARSGRVDAIIMDITHLTESLGWELNTCNKLLKPQQMILACGHIEGSEEDPWPPLLARLEQMLGAEFVAGCQRFNYQRPRTKSRLDKLVSGQRERKAIKLRKLHEVEFLGLLDKAWA